MTAHDEFIVRDIKRLMRFAFFLYLGIGAPRKEVGIRLVQIVKSPSARTWSRQTSRIVPFSNRMELPLQRHRVGIPVCISFRNGFLVSLVGLIRCFPVLSSPVVHEAPSATSTLKVLHLFGSRVHADFVRLFIFDAF